MKYFYSLLLLFPTLLFSETYWQQHVHYTIDAKLDALTHKIHGKETLVYTNNSPDTLHYVYFRLYWNLFIEGSKGDLYSQRNKSYWHDATGSMTVHSFSIIEQDAPQEVSYSIDNTLMKIDLPSPLSPGEQITFSCTWTGKIPEGGERTSHQGRDYDIAQWYPQIATYDKLGWDKSQYLGPAEFNNEFGMFDVNITLPKSFTMGFSGELLNPGEVYPESVQTKLREAEGKTETVRIADYSTTEWKNGEDTTMVTWKFHADNVRDFAWSANENYIWDVSHYAPNDGEQPVTIHALYFPDKAKFWNKAAEYGRHAISYFSEHFGRYAYKNCFVVEGPVGGGMEYPGITFIGHYGEEGSHSPFGVIVHEVGHNWFPMMVNSNETHYAFMDEGFTTFLTAVGTEAYWGNKDNSFVWTEWYQKLFDFRNDNVRDAIQRDAIWLAKTGYEEPTATHIYRFTEGNYGTSIYSKTGTILYMLQYVLGDSVFESAMKEYFRRWKFKHPYPEDFFTAIQEASGRRDLRWFFDQWFQRTTTCDYGICGLNYTVDESNGQQVYKTSFHVYRQEKNIMPLDVEIQMANGEKQTIWIPVDKWFNAEVGFDTTIELPAKPVRAELNPDGRIVDMNRLNNRTGLPRVEVEFDNTMHLVPPMDAYLIRWRPSFWYTDEGGWNFGYKLSGSFMEDMNRATLYNLYNIREQKVDYDLNISHNLYKLSPLMSLDGRAYSLEGREGFLLSVGKGFRKHYSTPPFHTVHLGYDYSYLLNKDYLLLPQTWDAGRLHRLTAGYTYYNRWKDWNINASAAAEGSSSLFGQSDFQFSKRTFLLKANINLSDGSTLGIRLFNGIGFGNIPNQAKYYLNGASPVDQFNMPFFRSKGMLPSTVRDHAFAPGGGNLRGYYTAPISGEKIDAFTIEWKWTSYLPVSSIRIPYANYILRYLRGSVFLDAGRITSANKRLWDERFEIDLGVGFRLSSFNSLLGALGSSNILTGLGLRTLRVDFPFYMSNPLPGENKVKFRWAVSVSEVF